jgi:F0F1-type ATP synthase assembly protein I
MLQQSSWGRTVGTAVGLQWGVILLLAALLWVWVGTTGAVSEFLGGSAVALPNTVLALWLTVRVVRYGNAGAGALLFGELLKLALTIALLVVVVTKQNAQLWWPGLLVGVVAALKAQWLALWFTRRA